jgi:hypothetical protein
MGMKDELLKAVAQRPERNRCRSMIRALPNCAAVADQPATRPFRDRDRERRLVVIQSNERVFPQLASPPFLTRHQPIPCNPRTQNAAAEAAEPVRSHTDHGV